MNREQGTGNREQRKTEPPPRASVSRGLLAAFASLVFCSLFPVPCSLHAESPPHVEQVHVGLPGGQGEQESARSRNGAWAPVYVKLKAGPEGNARDRFRIRVETSDSENTVYHYDTNLPALVPNQDYLAVAYIRPGGAGSDFTIQLQNAAGQSIQGVPPVTREADKETLEPKDVLYLSVGARLPGMKRALLADPALANVADDDLADKKGTVRFAYMDDVPQMPDRWFGYEAADVVVLATGSQTFITSLNEDAAAPQRKALAEWVRRGGKLIVSVGANRQLAAEVLDKMPLPDFDKMPLIHCGIEGSATVPDAANLARWLAGNEHVPELHNVEITRLTPGEGVSVLVSESAKVGDKTQDCPVVVEASCGLGRVWLTAFDVDGPPFTTWPEGQKAFWTRVQAEFTPKAVARVQPGQPAPPGMNNPAMGDGFSTDPPSLLGEVQRALENFEKVPVVNFGWVALFILVYIVIVGPLDYFLLKRVFKRLELTWITFPAVVVVVSAAAYCTAYYLKGDDLRINKIDIVEYDLGAPQEAYGTSWFTLFSPRIQNYTVSLEPSAPVWVAPPPADATSHAVTVAALANPDLAERVGSSSLFRQPYAYAEDASGLERVPIPVWSTRSFQASWRAGIDPARPPIIASLSHARDENDLRPKLAGTITNGLPVELQSVTLFYRGSWYSLPNGIGPGDSFDVKSLFADGKIGRPANQWVSDPKTLAPSLVGPAGVPAAAPNDNNGFNNFQPGQAYAPVKRPFELVKDMMFHAKAEGSQMLNSSLRPLDQSWRLDPEKTASGKALYRDEVVLVARTPTLSDKSETVAKDPGSATRLWLDRLPDGKSSPPALTGYLAQETYVRAYIPVKPNQPDGADKP